MKRRFGQRARVVDQEPTEIELEAERGRMLIEESREFVLVLDDSQRVIAFSRRARESLEGLEEGQPVPPGLLSGAQAFTIPYDLDGHTETLVYLRRAGDLAAYEELRAGFTAAVSHELRTPLARLLALLESALLPDSEVVELIEQARAEVGQIRELIDDVLFLSELETGREVVALGSTPVLTILREVVESLGNQAARAGVGLTIEGDDDIELPVRPRMLRVIASNLALNSIRYSGPGSAFVLSIRRDEGAVLLQGKDDGVGVGEDDLPRLFERFYRADRARASRGTGLGLAIVKHIVSAAGGTVEARSARGAGLTITCSFPLA
jgi:two-component system, OmpR family, phosphate regulon sensor histidine kinase PhoR